MTQAKHQAAPQADQSLADPFAQIFLNRAEANWAFDFLLATVKQLGLTEKEKVPVTLQIRARNLRRKTV